MCGLLRERNAGWNSLQEPAPGSSGLKMETPICCPASPTVASNPFPGRNGERKCHFCSGHSVHGHSVLAIIFHGHNTLWPNALCDVVF